jgi:hypothetical protein
LNIYIFFSLQDHGWSQRASVAGAVTVDENMLKKQQAKIYINTNPTALRLLAIFQ